MKINETTHQSTSNSMMMMITTHTLNELCIHQKKKMIEKILVFRFIFHFQFSVFFCCHQKVEIVFFSTSKFPSVIRVCVCVRGWLFFSWWWWKEGGECKDSSDHIFLNLISIYKSSIEKKCQTCICGSIWVTIMG